MTADEMILNQYCFKLTSLLPHSLSSKSYLWPFVAAISIEGPGNLQLQGKKFTFKELRSVSAPSCTTSSSVASSSSSSLGLRPFMLTSVHHIPNTSPHPYLLFQHMDSHFCYFLFASSCVCLKVNCLTFYTNNNTFIHFLFESLMKKSIPLSCLMH